MATPTTVIPPPTAFANPPLLRFFNSQSPTNDPDRPTKRRGTAKKVISTAYPMATKSQA